MGNFPNVLFQKNSVKQGRSSFNVINTSYKNARLLFIS